MKKVTAVVIGAGQRGQGYAEYAKLCPDKLQIVGVASPQQFQRERLAAGHSIVPEHIFSDWTEMVEKAKFADCVIICTPDRLHKDPAVAFAKMGYHILLEKPMAVTYADCVEIVETCRVNNVMLAVGHVLRYSPEATKIKDIIQSGAIGEVASIQHHEPVGFYHFAHSFVRGNWNSVDTSTFMLLAKSCHDIDLIQMWMGERRCTAVSSFGSLLHFNKANKPAGAASRCLDCGVEAGCPYSAKKIYLDSVKQGNTHWPVNVITDVPDIESVTSALRTGPYGRCVYESDNDVVDNQVVNMQYEGGATVNFLVVAFTERLCERQTKIFGTKGQLTCDFDMKVHQFDFLTRRRTCHDLAKEDTGRMYGGGHGGADMASIEAFVRAVTTGDRAHILTDADSSLLSHKLCFAAEKSRLEGRVIDPTREALL